MAKKKETKTPEVEVFKHKTIYEVVCVRECRETFREVEFVTGRYTVEAVATFRANGAMMFAEVGDKSRCFVRPVTLIEDESIEVYLTRLGKGVPS